MAVCLALSLVAVSRQFSQRLHLQSVPERNKQPSSDRLSFFARHTCKQIEQSPPVEMGDARTQFRTTLAAVGPIKLFFSSGVPVLVPVRASPVPSVVRARCLEHLECSY